jgi:hypothetical protein
MKSHQILSIVLATLFFVVMFAWGLTLTLGLRGGDEGAASVGTAFIMLATIMFGDTILTQYKIASSDGSPANLFRMSRIASAFVGGLFVSFLIFGALASGYREMMVCRAIGYGFIGLLVVYMSGSYLHYHQMTKMAEETLQSPIGGV